MHYMSTSSGELMCSSLSYYSNYSSTRGYQSMALGYTQRCEYCKSVVNREDNCESCGAPPASQQKPNRTWYGESVG